MIQSGVTELIWHFAGYLHLTDELARARVQYEEMEAGRVVADYEPDAPIEPTKIGELEELGSGRTYVYWPHFEGQAYLSPAHGAWAISAPQWSGALDLDLGLHRMPAAPTVDIALAGERDTSLKRQEGGDETNVDIDQYNLLNDSDRFGVSEGLTTTAVTGIDVTAEVRSMVDSAEEVEPEGQFPLGGGNVGVVGANLAEAQTSRAESGEAPSQVDFGVYVNGVLQVETGAASAEPGDDATEEGTDGRREGAPPPIPEQPDGWQPGDPGLQGVELGSNAASNAAIIIDADEACGTMVILGDYYKTNSVAQTNVYTDSDHIRIAGNGAGAGVEAIVALNAHETTNEAELSKEPLFDEVIDYRGLTGYHWDIDMSYGDYYDVKSIYQENVIYSGDITCQTLSSAHYRVMTDANGQANIASVADLGQGYDLIVVLGNYYGGNFIHQTNILHDSDWVTMTSLDEGGSQSVYGGQNQLTNQGAISEYGLNGFESISEDFETFVRNLETANEIEPEEWWSYSGSGSTEMKVLFVTGNYYDINFIRQFNIIADADAAMQVGGNGADQFVSTGGNTATNSAAIFDVGAYGDQYLGGEAYEEWTLIQTNIIAADDDEIVYGDATQLAGEVVVFAYTPDEDDDQTGAGAMLSTAAGDELGHMMS